MMGFGLIWIVLVIGAIAYLVGIRPDSFRRERPGNTPREDPIEILKQRYARGEISQEEYRQILHDMQS